MKISKDSASNIATKLLSQKYKILEDMRIEYRTLATREYQGQVPKEVTEVFKKYPEYINTCSNLMFNGNGFNFEHISAIEPVIQNKKTSYNTVILSNKFADKMFKLKTKIDKLSKEYKTLFSETNNALLSLGTTKRIEENFPEAIPYLPVSESLLPIANLESLRKKISE